MQNGVEPQIDIPIVPEENVIQAQPSIVASQLKAQFAIVSYMAASSTMLIINKVAVYLFPIPTVLLAIQLFVSSAIIFVLGNLGFLIVDPLEWDKIRQYIGVVFVFLANIYTNIKALQYSNVETVIVFRTCTTLAIAYGDFRFLNRGPPNSRVLATLMLIVIGAIIYVMMDSSVQVESYFWVGLYFFFQCLDVLYIKYITNSVQMTSWGRSFYNNTLALPVILVVSIATGEFFKVNEFFAEGYFTNFTYFMIFLSCVMGLGISYTGFLCREAVSATSYSVVGNMNKVLTVMINCAIWDKHASTGGLFGLLLSLVGGALYTKLTQ
jgi:solute carrier family 35 protein